MNVLMVSNSSECYGASNSMLDMIDALKRRGIQVIVFLHRKGGIERVLKSRGIRYHVIPYRLCAAASITQRAKYQRFFGDMLLAWKTRKLVHSLNIDLIHTNASNVDFGAMLADICQLPHIWHIRELLYQDYRLRYDLPRVEKRFMLRSDCLIYISRYVAQKRACGAVHVVWHDGVDLRRYMLQEKELFSEDKIHILYCGMITKEKGTIDAIRAVRELVRSGFRDISLDIVGALNEYASSLKERVRADHLEGYITFHGHQADVERFRKTADLAVVCSRSEALGRVTIESMLAGCLVIGADRGGTLELIQDGKNGLIYRTGDHKDLAEKILAAYRDKEKSKKMIHDAKEYARKQFDSDAYAERMCRLYARCARP